MCGRYTLFTDEENEDIRNIIEEVGRKFPESDIKTGEIFPTNQVPVLSANGAIPMVWGFPKFKGKGVIINARAETAAEKKTFKSCLLSRRYIIPSTGFYEWKQDTIKQKYWFRVPGATALYMAGLYQEYEGRQRFVILTTEANQSMSDIHNRMPVILSENQREAWLKDNSTVLNLLSSCSPELSKTAV